MAKTKQKVQMPTAIRRKMSAAISMLLVACIMLVGSTYAWFTLSTAPEVKGITTKVGANGNLEIALLDENTYGDMAKIKTDEGDSMDTANKSVKDANITWGNLVDLGTVYGLNNISLAPSELNISTVNYVEGETTKVASSTIGTDALLRTPEYGSDGRVASVSANTVTGIFEETAFKFNATKYGVRAIGTASALTERQIAYRNAISNATAYNNQAKSLAKASLEDNGSDLAAIAIGIAAGNDTFEIKYKDTFTKVINKIEEANTAIANSIKAVTIAETLKNGRSVEDSAVNSKVSAINNSAISVDDLKTASGLSDLPEEITKAITNYSDTANKISGARTKISALTGNTIAINDIKAILSFLMDTDKILICNTSISDSDLANKVISAMNNGGIVIELPTGSGVYSNISDSVGNYSAKITTNVNATISNTTLKLDNITATIKTTSIKTGDVVSNKYYLATALAAVKGQEPEGTVSSDATITDTYGYALDFAFRTNAADAKLMLQTAEKQRVYSDSVAHGTQGAGSYMEFTTSDNFGEEDVKNLMGAIRVAFVSGTDVLGMAKLNLNSDVNTESVNNQKKIKADLYMCEYDYDMQGSTNVADGVLKIGDIKDDASILALTQNSPTRVSVIVYLDGNEVDNSMVANAQNSMSGKLNLQFTTDAELTPMENSALRNAIAKDVTEFTEVDITEENKTTIANNLGVSNLIVSNLIVYKGNDGNYYYSTDGGTTKISIPYNTIKNYLP